MNAHVEIAAEPFGLGPSSKAQAIAQSLIDEGATVSITGAAFSVDYIHRNVSTLVDPSRDSGVLVVCGSPSAAREGLRAGKCVVYVDSLGFMWGPHDISGWGDWVHDVIYCAQDCFGAVANLRRLGVRRLVSVGSITCVDLDSWSGFEVGSAQRSPIVNFGGAVNPFAERRFIAEYIALCARALQGQKIWSVHGSKQAMGLAQGEFLETHCEELDKSEFLLRAKQARGVFSSPGLTFLLEAQFARIGYAPLPPQNASQVHIVHHMNGLGGRGGGAWGLLARWFPVSSIRRLPECKAVAWVQSKLLEYSSDQDCVEELLECYSDQHFAPPGRIASSLDGSEAVAHIALGECLR